MKGILLAAAFAVAQHALATALILAGDSTLDEHGGDESVYASWGASLRTELAAGSEVVDFAKCGCSTKSFRDKGHWGKVLDRIRPGDFVLIQFGHNDQKLNVPEIAVPEAQFKTNLLQMVAEVRARKGEPMLATPIVRLTYKDGHLVDTAKLDAWAARLTEAAAEAKVPLVDMRRMTREAADKAGETEALTWYAPNDRTHPAVKGARLYARMFLEDVRKRELPVAKLFKSR